MVATVRCLEYVGDAPGVAYETTYLNLMQVDAPSGGERGFIQHPIRPRLDGAPSPSTERWFRFHFKPPFTQVFDFYFWMPDLVLPPAWSLTYGTSKIYIAPGQGDSAIATRPVPTTKPEAPNAGGVPPLDGEQEQYSDWIVLQAHVRNDAVVGPALGFDAVNSPRPLQYRFDWTEL